MTPETIGTAAPARPSRHPRGPARRLAALAVAALLASFLPSLAPSVAGAADAEPNHVQFTLEGCRGSVASFEGATELSDFVCADHEYTTGNLGPGWNELDLVPHRLTTTSGTQSNVTETFEVNISADSVESGRTGYDFISVPVINEALSDPSCEVVAGEQQTKTPGIGGTDTTIYRTLTITQDPGTTCVFDYVQRLAIGASKYPGSSLHSNLSQADFSVGGIGARDVSIPVKQIQPQSIDKDMAATQGASHVWNITKSPSPATLNFADTCSSDPGALQQPVQITVSWEKLPADPGGDITVVTNIYATNPAHRAITVTVTDVIYSGTNTVEDTATFGPLSVPANTTNELIATHTTTVDDGATYLHDVATATYTDTITSVPVPGTRTANASATVQQSTDPADNFSATITDVEDITGDGLTYSVDSLVSGSATGTFDEYEPGTETDGSVSWTSSSQPSSGSVTFNKTVYVDGPMVTSGTLSDTATLTGDDDFTTSASASVAITSDATTTLTINKTIPNVLDGDETVTFTFIVYEDGDTSGTPVDSKDITFTAGETTKSISFSLPPGLYDVEESAPEGWTTDLDGEDVDLTLPICNAALNVTNSFGPGTAEAVKVSDPVGAENGWVMCLAGPGTEGLNPDTEDAGKECVTTTTVDERDGVAEFATTLEEGTYTISEKTQAGWDQTGADGCTFTVDYPADFDGEFTCTITNTERGTVTVIKTSSGAVPPDGAFTFQIREDASATEPGTVVAADSNDATGTVDFDSLVAGLQPGDYQLCETDMSPGWHSSLSDDPGAFVPDSDADDVDNSVICVAFTLDPGEDEVFNVDNTPPPGGDARTIGYWRNWSSCTGGNQDPVLDETLSDAEGIFVGDLLVDTCPEAFWILSKSSLDGTKRASDPAYNLAAQLLASLLNVEAGAGVCQAAADAMNEAQALLAGAGFDGSTSYGGSSGKGKGKKASDTPTGTIDGARANQLAEVLDAYNNNELC